ncbi:hypothetical protein HrrHc1_005 [Halorubrum phage Hardycor1]|nr:hypothetical protein HrrHc1_005 [Halorubrum phage Hardycor1]
MSENTDDTTNDESESESAEQDLVTVDLPERTVEASVKTEKVVTGPHEGDPVPYHRIVPDTTKPYDALNCYERRAVLLDRIETAGHPRALASTYAELGDEFGVAKSTIANDMNRISEYVAENLERDHHMIVDAVFRGAIRDLVEDGKKAWAAELGKEWYDWLADMGQVERVADDVNLNVSQERNDTDEYTLVPDDEAEAVESTVSDPAPAGAIDGGDS